MRLIPEPPGKIEGGKILFDNMDIAQMSLSEVKDIRGKRISMIFQEPMTSLNPVKTNVSTSPGTEQKREHGESY